MTYIVPNEKARKMSPALAAALQAIAPRGEPLELPAINGPATVFWKDEATIKGRTVGPVIVTDADAYAAAGSPFFWQGAPSWRHELPWMPASFAKLIAAYYGAKLERG